MQEREQMRLINSIITISIFLLFYLLPLYLLKNKKSRDYILYLYSNFRKNPIIYLKKSFLIFTLTHLISSFTLLFSKYTSSDSNLFIYFPFSPVFTKIFATIFHLPDLAYVIFLSTIAIFTHHIVTNKPKNSKYNICFRRSIDFLFICTLAVAFRMCIAFSLSLLYFLLDFSYFPNLLFSIPSIPLAFILNIPLLFILVGLPSITLSLLYDKVFTKS